MSDFEQRLRNLVPEPATTSEADMMFRCGWEAAMESLGQGEGTQQSVQLQQAGRVVDRQSAKHGQWARPFCGGIIAGLAVALLLALGLSAELWPTSESGKRMAEGEHPVEGNRPNHAIGTEAGAVDLVDSPESETPTTDFGPQQFALAADSMQAIFGSISMQVARAKQISVGRPGDPISAPGSEGETNEEAELLEFDSNLQLPVQYRPLTKSNAKAIGNFFQGSGRNSFF
ncbi:MAG: hypothetical protein AAF483_08010 [Planctomycetota bacterium]